MHYEFFDPREEFTIYYHRLPHWDQPGVMCFITGGTADSIPAEVINRWRAERAVWLRHQGIDPQAVNWRVQLKLLSPAERRDYHQRFTSPWMECLDECHGACVLRKPHLSAIVADAFHHGSGQRFEISDYVVMPNHVHLLAQFRDEGDMQVCCRDWKHYTARRINRELKQSGPFWQVESFDHLVRSPAQFEYLRAYIANNPTAARLTPTEYRHYQRAF